MTDRTAVSPAPDAGSARTLREQADEDDEDDAKPHHEYGVSPGWRMPSATTAPAVPRPRLGPAAPAVAAEIRTEFGHGWSRYKSSAWGHDEVIPALGEYREVFAAEHPVGLTIIESLDALYLLELDRDLAEAVDWISHDLDLEADAEFDVATAVTRLVGGLLAGYLATHRRGLLDRCRELADRLLPAFTASPTGAPYRRVNLRTGEVSGPVNPLAGIGTNILEFGVLTQLTGDPGYYRVAKRAYRAAMQRRCPLAGHGAALNVETGEWAESADLAPPGDSFYEYLWGAWAMFRDRDTLRWYRMCLGGGAERDYGSWAESGQPAPAGSIQEAFTRYLRTGGEAHRMAAYQRLQELKASGELLAGPWSATTLKFLYLLFARSPRFDYRRHHISAGGKVLRGLLPARR